MTPDQWSQFTPDRWATFRSFRAGQPRLTSRILSHDPVGNRLLQNSSGQLTTFAYDVANQLATSVDDGGRTTYTFDATGNLALQVAPAGRTTYAWDIENHLTKLWLPSSVVNTMIYNADGLRIGKSDSSGTGKFVWDQQNLLLETDVSNVTQTEYTLKPDYFGSLISQRRSGSSPFPSTSMLPGSTTGLSDGTQTLTDGSGPYQAYGDFGRTDWQHLVNPFQWVGKLGYYFDNDPGQYYIRREKLQPSVGGVDLSQDPVGSVGGINFYDYANRSPLIRTDPSEPLCGFRRRRPWCLRPPRPPRLLGLNLSALSLLAVWRY